MNSNKNEYSKESVDIQNIKSVLRMNDFLKRLFYSYNSICESLESFIEKLYEIYNELNFQNISQEIVESYNKLIVFLFETMSGILSDTISGTDCNETFIIKPIDTNYYSHKLNINYFIDNCTSISRFLGSVSNVSVRNINDQITIQRNESVYIFVKLPSDCYVSIDDFRFHLDNYIFQIKQLLGFFYKDIDYVKNAIRTLLGIIEETININTSKKYIKKWTHVVKEVANSIKLIHACKEANNKCS